MKRNEDTTESCLGNAAGQGAWNSRRGQASGARVRTAAVDEGGAGGGARELLAQMVDQGGHVVKEVVAVGG